MWDGRELVKCSQLAALFHLYFPSKFKIKNPGYKRSGRLALYVAKMILKLPVCLQFGYTLSADFIGYFYNHTKWQDKVLAK